MAGMLWPSISWNVPAESTELSLGQGIGAVAEISKTIGHQAIGVASAVYMSSLFLTTQRAASQIWPSAISAVAGKRGQPGWGLPSKFVEGGGHAGGEGEALAKGTGVGLDAGGGAYRGGPGGSRRGS